MRRRRVLFVETPRQEFQAPSGHLPPISPLKGLYYISGDILQICRAYGAKNPSGIPSHKVRSHHFLELRIVADEAAAEIRFRRSQRH